jgi:hypothetical protein
MEAGLQGVPAPLITVQTPYEKVRVIRISKAQYNMLRSFAESSLRNYPWRTGYEYPDRFEWVKEGKWTLTVFKNVEIAKAEKLPTRGIFKVTTNVTPFAVLSRGGNEVMFVLVGGEVGMLYNGRVMLAFTREAPVAFAPIVPVPFSRLIPVYEVLDVLNHYVSL